MAKKQKTNVIKALEQEILNVADTKIVNGMNLTIIAQGVYARALADSTAYTKNEIARIVGAAPEALDTLYELAAALGNDPEFSTTVLNLIGEKAPIDHDHMIADVANLQAELNARSLVGHTHTIAQVSNLQGELNNRATVENLTTHTGNTTVHVTAAERTSWNGRVTQAELTDAIDGMVTEVNWSDINNIPTTFPPSIHNHTIAQVTGLQADLNTRATVAQLATHTGDTTTHITTNERTSWNSRVTQGELTNAIESDITWGNINNVPTTFPPSTHNHTIAQVNNLQTELNNRAVVDHTHTIANVTGLQNQLDNRPTVANVTTQINNSIATIEAVTSDSRVGLTHNGNEFATFEALSRADLDIILDEIGPGGGDEGVISQILERLNDLENPLVRIRRE